MSKEEQLVSHEVEAFFGRDGKKVAEELSATWALHPDRKKLYKGQPRILGLQTSTITHLVRVDEVILYTDEYTLSRWPKSRGPEISSLSPGDVIGYKFHSSVLPFIKTRGAENIMLSSLTPVNSLGEAKAEEEGILTPAKISSLIGLEHGRHAHFLPFDFRGTRAFLLTTLNKPLTDEEMQKLEDELLKDDK